MRLVAIGLLLSVPGVASGHDLFTLGAGTAPRAAVHCVTFQTPSRLPAGESFAAPLGNGLEFSLVSDGDTETGGHWDIRVMPTEEAGDYVWVVSPPYQSAPHRQIGRGYNLTASQSARLSPRRLRFVTSPREYDEATKLAETAMTDARAGITIEHIVSKGQGTLSLWITGFGVATGKDALTWITVRGRACQPR